LLELKELEQKSQGQKIFHQTEEFFAVKREFLNARQTAIKELQRCYNQLANSHEKYGSVEEVNKAVNSLGEITPTLGIPKALAGISNLVSSFFQGKFSAKSNEAFQEYLTNDDQKILPCFDKFYNSLVSTLEMNQELEISANIIKILG
jgi:hypothetical protein